ncbi:MAG TPA: hypothetical protein VEX41_02750 [Candidatus Eisenbacteria bacterium]|nr:hypothetical protein [Candidatus Eisenbacteria bacterium]
MTVDRPSADLFVALPPWLVPFDTTTAIFANEVVDPGAQGIQLMAEGPRTAEPQPGPGESMERWLLRRIESPAAGQPRIRQVTLPAGAALLVERLDGTDTRFAWRFAAYAIRTPFGVAFLQIDGPPDAWVGREDELAQIPWLIRVGPGRPVGRRSRGAAVPGAIRAAPAPGG